MRLLFTISIILSFSFVSFNNARTQFSKKCLQVLENKQTLIFKRKRHIPKSFMGELSSIYKDDLSTRYSEAKIGDDKFVFSLDNPSTPIIKAQRSGCMPYRELIVGGILGDNLFLYYKHNAGRFHNYRILLAKYVNGKIVTLETAYIHGIILDFEDLKKALRKKDITPTFTLKEGAIADSWL